MTLSQKVSDWCLEMLIQGIVSRPGWSSGNSNGGHHHRDRDRVAEFYNNRFTGHSDAIDYEGGGGICRDNIFEGNSIKEVDGNSIAAYNLFWNNGTDNQCGP